MPPACDQVIGAGNNMLRTTHNLKQDPLSHKIRFDLVDSARNVLEGTMKVYLCHFNPFTAKCVKWQLAKFLRDKLYFSQM